MKQPIELVNKFSSGFGSPLVCLQRRFGLSKLITPRNINFFMRKIYSQAPRSSCARAYVKLIKHEKDQAEAVLKEEGRQ